MKTVIFFFATLPILLFGQTEKGASPLAAPSAVGRPPSAVTRAVVIGISDYQEKDIPDLRFADRDAEAFATFLRSPAGGSLDGDHLKLLTNSAATTAQFDNALGWLLDESKEGDEAIIYFSGHGDVETRTLSQQGFLLCWDSPPQAYVSGAYPIFFLKEVVSTLSIQNKARVIVITDACRAGKLAGNTIGGAQLTSQNLAQQFANEVKILSCQPNEFSIEGEQWGGGRGAFSFHLVDGLYGMADANTDGSVNLMEIGRYLDDHVTTEVAPQSQVPMTVGNRTEKLAAVFSDLLAQVKKNKAGQPPTFSPTENRGIEEDVLAAADTSVRKLYRLFKQALKEKNFFAATSQDGQELSEAETADGYYLRLMAEPKLARLHNSMRRNYAAALQDDAQQAVNNLMKMEKTETRLYRLERLKKYAPYPRYLQRAAELLGAGHYMYPTLRARQAYFEGAALQMESPLSADSVLGERILGKYRAALGWQPDAALTYFAMGEVFESVVPNEDSVVIYLQKTMDAAPGWPRVYSKMARFLVRKKKQFDEAFKVLDKGFAIDSSQAILWDSYGLCLWVQGKSDECVPYLLKAIALDSTYTDACVRLGTLHFEKGKSMESIAWLLRAVQTDKPSENSFGYLGAAYYYIGQYDKAEEYYNKALEIEPDSPFWLAHFAGTYLKTHRILEANALFQRALAYDSTNWNIHRAIGEMYDDSGFYAEAETAYLKAIAIGSVWGLEWQFLGRLYLHTKRYAEGEVSVKKAIAMDSTNLAALTLLGQVYLAAGRYEEARKNFAVALGKDAENPLNYVQLALLSAVEGKTAEALDFTEKAFQKGMRFEAIYADPEYDFAPVRGLQGFKVLEKKYFPEKAKD